MNDRGGIVVDQPQLADGSWLALESGELTLGATSDMRLWRGATLAGPDECYRYDLWRRWDDGPLLGFIMLNPSTADALVDDHTIRRCCFYARREEFAGIVVRNLFAYRTPSPRALKAVGVAEAIGPENDEWVDRLLTDKFGVKRVVAAWGAVERWALPRVDEILQTAAEFDRPLWALGFSKQGWPRHPSRLSNDAELSVYLRP